MRVALLLACVAAPLAGQSVRSRLETRVPAAAIPVVDSLVQVAGREGLPGEPRESALHAIADLVAHRLDADSSATLVIDAIHAGLRGGRLLDVSHAVLEEQQRGRTWAESFVRVRDELPDVPAAPKPGEGTAQADTSKTAKTTAKKGTKKHTGKKPAAKPAAAKDTSKSKM